jgi:hypothetical protein
MLCYSVSMPSRWLVAWLMGCHWKGRKPSASKIQLVKPSPVLEIEGLELWLT